uniref:Glycosyltransferase 25 family member n=2 Tax=Rhabditophanes sp. KR3021 TaxID=114890 RepID=A0AC35U0R8_9BILA
MRLLFLVFCLLLPTNALFPGAKREDGDYRHLYPIVSISFKVTDSDLSALPYLLGTVENWEYPKDRIHIDFFLEHQFETAKMAVSQWQYHVKSLFRSVDIHEKVQIWQESALVMARRRSSNFVLISTIYNLLSKKALSQLTKLDLIAVTPFLVDAFEIATNADTLANIGDNYLNQQNKSSIVVEKVLDPILINLKKMDASYLTFDDENVLGLTKTDKTTANDVLLHSAKVMGISIYMNNEISYGDLLDINDSTTKSQIDEVVSLHVANHISEHGLNTLPVSVYIKPFYPIPKTFGFDKIYLINLGRRKERMRKMREILKVTGIKYERWNAVDGKELSEEEVSKSITFLPGYKDPIYKRPMKMGEIGCFMSHYGIWAEVISKVLSRVIVFEDDIRFSKNAIKILRESVVDLDKTNQEWDLIYFGRKKESKGGREFFVAGHSYLSTVTYSYWTLGYALSYSGALKLVAGKPLEKMVALDEYIPIMFDSHPNKEWSSHFPNRDLKAFTTFPLIVTPQRYTNQEGYISDTEDSTIVESNTRKEYKNKDFKDKKATENKEEL